MGSAPRRTVPLLLLAVLLLLPGTSAARAKRWAVLAPAPLGSDSAYAALSARPPDSLSVRELAWLDVQRDWRSQREGEESALQWGAISGSGAPHHARPHDARFAALASRPFADLGEDERTWLITENAEQRLERSRAEGAGNAVGAALLLGLVGVVVGMALVVSALSHARFGF